jgi:hypothetical protein
MNAEIQRESARTKSGKFGEQAHSAAEVSLTADVEVAPELWEITVHYPDGGFDKIEVDSNGHLPKPFRSDSLMLVNLVGFTKKAYSGIIDYTFPEAIADTGAVLAHLPVFETYDGETTLRGQVIGFDAK